jgi:hypothetical protein
MKPSVTCRHALSPEDVEFILNSLDPGGEQKESLAALLADEGSWNAVLDHPALLKNLLDHTGCLSVSPGFYFYVVTRHSLLRKGIQDPALSDYLGRVLCHFSSTRMLSEKSTEEHSRHLFPYVSDLLAQIGEGSSSVSVRKRIELGDVMLFVSGIFCDVIEHRRAQRAAPPVDFYESVGAAQYRLVAEDRLMRDSAEAQVFRDLGEVFHELRLALNDLASRLLHMDENPRLISLQA